MKPDVPAFGPPGAKAPPPAHRVVIVGGGAAGLELAVRLGDRHRGRRLEVLLIDRSLTHVWKPLLHEVASGTLALRDDEVDFLQQARRRHFRFHLGTLESLDRARRQLWLAPLVDDVGEEIAPRRPIPYDTAVIALGSVVNDFGTKGVREHAMTLDEAGDARRFYRRLLAACARAELRRDGPVKVVIVGGGATGVELAAELAESTTELALYGEQLSRLERPVQLHVVESAPRLVAALPEEMARRVHADLVRRGVDVRTGQRVTEVTRDQVILRGGETLRAHLVVWAAGIQGPEVLQQLGGLELGKARQLVVRPTLQTTLDDDVFAIGDCASCTLTPGGRPVPPTAQAAQQEAHWLARALRQRLEGRPLPAFSFRDKGALVSLGRSNAVGRVAGGFAAGHSLLLHGLLARWTYWAVHRRHMMVLQGVPRTALAILGGWLAGRMQPRVKLH